MVSNSVLQYSANNSRSIRECSITTSTLGSSHLTRRCRSCILVHNSKKRKSSIVNYCNEQNSVPMKKKRKEGMCWLCMPSERSNKNEPTQFEWDLRDIPSVFIQSHFEYIMFDVHLIITAHVHHIDRHHSINPHFTVDRKYLRYSEGTR